MSIPDLTGFTLTEAVEVLESRNISYRVVVTSPPRERPQEPDSQSRIVRMNLREIDEVQLMVCNINIQN